MRALAPRRATWTVRESRSWVAGKRRIASEALVSSWVVPGRQQAGNKGHKATRCTLLFGSLASLVIRNVPVQCMVCLMHTSAHGAQGPALVLCNFLIGFGAVSRLGPYGNLEGSKAKSLFERPRLFSWEWSGTTETRSRSHPIQSRRPCDQSAAYACVHLLEHSSGGDRYNAKAPAPVAHMVKIPCFEGLDQSNPCQRPDLTRSVLSLEVTLTPRMSRKPFKGIS